MENYDLFLEFIKQASLVATEIDADFHFIFQNENDKNKLLTKYKDFIEPYVDTTYRGNELKLEKKELNIKFYKDYSTFRNRFEYPDETVREIVYSYFSEEDNDVNVIKIQEAKIINSEDFISKQNYKAINVFYWEAIYNLLIKSNVITIESGKDFSISSIKKGTNYFKYEKYNSSFDKIDVGQIYNNLNEAIETTKQYPMFLKNELVDEEQVSQIPLSEFIKKVDKICNKIKLDMEIFLLNIDFDKKIDKFKNNNNKIFNNLQSVLNRVGTNIFTYIFTVIAAMFSFEQVSRIRTLSTIYILFMSLSAIFIYFMECQKDDIKYNEKKLEDYIDEFSQYENIKKFIKTDAERIRNKIRNIKNTIKVFDIFVIFLFVLVSLVIFLGDNPILSVKNILNIVKNWFV